MSSTVLARETPAPIAVRRRLRRVVLTAAFVGASLAGGIHGRDSWLRGRYIEATDDSYVGGNITPLAPHVAGFIDEILVSDNERVGAGQILIRLDKRDFLVSRDRAAASLAAREAAAASARARYTLQLATIRQTEADLAAKSARAAFTAQDAERYRNLAVTATGSRQDAQRTFMLDQEARSAVLASAALLDAAREQLNILDAQIAEATASVGQARSDLRTAELNLDYTDIRAPIDGQVGNRAAQAGSYVAQGAYLLSVIPRHGLWVDANFKEDQLTRMAAGQPATVTADVLPDHVLRGRVVSLAPGTGAVFSVIPPENATGNFTKIVQRVAVRIELDAQDPALVALRPGLSATVRVDTRPGATAP